MKTPTRTLPATVSYPAGHLVTDSRQWRNQVPVLSDGECIGCRLCTVVCPEGALDPRGDGKPLVLDQWCKACGICLAVCPKKALTWRPA